MINFKYVLLGFLSTVVALSLGSKCFHDFKPPHLLCYYSAGTLLREVNFKNCTHLIFTNVVSKDSIADGLHLKEGMKQNLSSIKETNVNLVILFTLNLAEDDFVDVVRAENKSKRFMEEITSLLEENDFDGIEVNFESAAQTGISKESRTNFVKSLYKRLDSLHRRVKRSDYETVEEEIYDTTDPAQFTEKGQTFETSPSVLADERYEQTTESEEIEKTTSIYIEEQDDEFMLSDTSPSTQVPSIEQKEEEEEEDKHDNDDNCNKYWLIVRIPVKLEVIGKKYDLKALSKYSHLLTVSTHSMVNENGRNLTYHPSRLMGISDVYNTDSVVDFVLSLGAVKSKLVIALPAFVIEFRLYNSSNTVPGSPFVSGPNVYDQSKLCSLFQNKSWILERDEDLTAPFAYSGDIWLAFEDEISVDIKSKYILLRELAGGAIYSIDADVKNEKCTNHSNPNGSLTSALAKGFRNFGRKPRAAVLEELKQEIHDDDFLRTGGVKVSEYRIVRVVDHLGAIHAIRKNTRTQFECSRQGYFSHPLGCNRFYRCVKFDQYSDDYTVFEYDCPEGLAFDERWEVCVWPGSLPNGSPCTGSSEIAPVPRSHYQCSRQEGFYADPENCRWFFACLDHAQDGVTPLTAYEFRCPFGLVFNEEKLSCDWPWVVGSCGSTRENGYLGSSSSLHTTFLNNEYVEADFGQYGKGTVETPFGSYGRGFRSSFKSGSPNQKNHQEDYRVRIGKDYAFNLYKDDEDRSQGNSFGSYRDFLLLNKQIFENEKSESKNNENFAVDFRNSEGINTEKTTSVTSSELPKASLKNIGFFNSYGKASNNNKLLANPNLGSNTDALGSLFRTNVNSSQLSKTSNVEFENLSFGRYQSRSNDTFNSNSRGDLNTVNRIPIRNNFYENVKHGSDIIENPNDSQSLNYKSQGVYDPNNLYENSRNEDLYKTRASSLQNFGQNIAQISEVTGNKFSGSTTSGFQVAHQQPFDKLQNNGEYKVTHQQSFDKLQNNGEYKVTHQQSFDKLQNNGEYKVTHQQSFDKLQNNEEYKVTHQQSFDKLQNNGEYKVTHQQSFDKLQNNGEYKVTHQQSFDKLQNNEEYKGSNQRSPIAVFEEAQSNAQDSRTFISAATEGSVISSGFPVRVNSDSVTLSIPTTSTSASILNSFSYHESQKQLPFKNKGFKEVLQISPELGGGSTVRSPTSVKDITKLHQHKLIVPVTLPGTYKNTGFEESGTPNMGTLQNGITLTTPISQFHGDLNGATSHILASESPKKMSTTFSSNSLSGLMKNTVRYQVPSTTKSFLNSYDTSSELSKSDHLQGLSTRFDSTSTIPTENSDISVNQNFGKTIDNTNSNVYLTFKSSTPDSIHKNRGIVSTGFHEISSIKPSSGSLEFKNVNGGKIFNSFKEAYNLDDSNGVVTTTKTNIENLNRYDIDRLIKSVSQISSNTVRSVFNTSPNGSLTATEESPTTLNTLRKDFRNDATNYKSSSGISLSFQTPKKSSEGDNVFRNGGSFGISDAKTTNAPFRPYDSKSTGFTFGESADELTSRGGSHFGLLNGNTFGSSSNKEESSFKSSFGEIHKTTFSVPSPNRYKITSSFAPSETVDNKNSGGSAPTFDVETTEYKSVQPPKFKNVYFQPNSKSIENQNTNYYKTEETDFGLVSGSTLESHQKAIKSKEKSNTAFDLRLKPEINTIAGHSSTGFSTKMTFQPTSGNLKQPNIGENIFANAKDSVILGKSVLSSEKNIERTENEKNIFDSNSAKSLETFSKSAIRFNDPSTGHEQPTINRGSFAPVSKFDYSSVKSREEEEPNGLKDLNANTKAIGDVHQSLSIEPSSGLQKSLLNQKPLTFGDYGSFQGPEEAFKIVIPNGQSSYAKNIQHHVTNNFPEKQSVAKTPDFGPAVYEQETSTEKSSFKNYYSRDSGLLGNEEFETNKRQPDAFATISTPPSITTFSPKLNHYGQTTAFSASKKFKSEYLEPIIHNRSQLTKIKVLGPFFEEAFPVVIQKPIVLNKQEVHLYNEKNANSVGLSSFVPSTQVSPTAFDYQLPTEVDTSAYFVGQDETLGKVGQKEGLVTKPVIEFHNSIKTNEGEQDFGPSSDIPKPQITLKTIIPQKESIKPFKQTLTPSSTATVASSTTPYNDYQKKSAFGNGFNIDQSKTGNQGQQDLWFYSLPNRKQQFSFIEQQKQGEIIIPNLNLPAPVKEYSSLSSEEGTTVDSEVQNFELKGSFPLESYSKFFSHGETQNDTVNSSYLPKSNTGNSIKPNIKTYSSSSKQYGYYNDLSSIESQKAEKVPPQDFKLDKTNNFAYKSQSNGVSKNAFSGKVAYETIISGENNENAYRNYYESDFNKDWHEKNIFTGEENRYSESKKNNEESANLYLRKTEMKQGNKGRQGFLIDLTPATNKYEEYEIEKEIIRDQGTSSFGNGKAIIITQTSNANPILVGKLAGQCSCQSDSLDLKSNKKKSNDSRYKSKKQLIPGRNFNLKNSFDGDGLKTTLSTDDYDVTYVPNTSPFYGSEDLGGNGSRKPKTNSLKDVPEGKKTHFRGRARFQWPTPSSYYSESESSLPSLISAYRTANAEYEGYKVEESRTRNEIHEGHLKSQDIFDRYGPGGWRSMDETLQGSVDCKRPGLFRHPKYCNKFYACNYDPWEERFTLHVFQCPIRLTYDNSISACNWPVGGPACANDNLLV